MTVTRFAPDDELIFVEARAWGPLIGLNFLRQFNYQVRSGEGRLLVERLGA